MTRFVQICTVLPLGLMIACVGQPTSANEVSSPSTEVEPPSVSQSEAFTANQRNAAATTPDGLQKAQRAQANEFAGIGGVRKRAKRVGKVWAGRAYDLQPHEKPQSEDALMKTVRDQKQNLYVRANALIDLGCKKHEPALTLFDQLIFDKETDALVKRGALEGTFAFGGLRVLPNLFKVLERSPEGQLRAMSLEMIAEYRTADFNQALNYALEQEDAHILASAIRLLWDSEFSNHEIIEHLRKLALSSEQPVWQEALDGLRNAPYASVAEVLKEVVRKSDGLRQQIAVRYYRSWLREFPDLIIR